jgi:hypothetical protein
MATASHHHPYSRLDGPLTRLLGADTRLLYGFGVPIFATIGFILALVLTGETWMAAAALVFLVIALIVVVFGIVGMINEPDDGQAD